MPDSPVTPSAAQLALSRLALANAARDAAHTRLEAATVEADACEGVRRSHIARVLGVSPQAVSHMLNVNSRAAANARRREAHGRARAALLAA